MRLLLFAAAVLFSGALHAQGGNYTKARKACASQQGEERAACMRREICAQAKDPKECESHAKRAQAQREKMREACKDKQGEARRACFREQRAKLKS
jgi:hypothetical protein